MSYLEVVVAMALFGLTLSGMLATCVTHQRLAAALEQRVVVTVTPGVSLLRVADFVTFQSADPGVQDGDMVIDSLVLIPADDSLVGRYVHWARAWRVTSLSILDARGFRGGGESTPIDLVSRFSCGLPSLVSPYARVQEVKLDADGMEPEQTPLLDDADLGIITAHVIASPL
jgi:hypothetical protein